MPLKSPKASCLDIGQSWKTPTRLMLLLVCLMSTTMAGIAQASDGQAVPAVSPTSALVPQKSAVPASQPKTGMAQIGAVTSLLPSGFSSLEWDALTAAQKVALKPLAGHWGHLSDPQKRKWISLSTNYLQMTVEDQTKLHARMAQWAELSPKQRAQARLNFAELKKVAPEQKSEQWQAYQALSAQEKQALAKSAQPKPPRTALAAQPVASDKISRLPIQKNATGIPLPLAQSTLSKNTLLALPKAPEPPKSPKAPASGILHGTN